MNVWNYNKKIPNFTCLYDGGDDVAGDGIGYNGTGNDVDEDEYKDVCFIKTNNQRTKTTYLSIDFFLAVSSVGYSMFGCLTESLSTFLWVVHTATMSSVV